MRILINFLIVDNVFTLHRFEMAYMNNDKRKHIYRYN